MKKLSLLLFVLIAKAAFCQKDTVGLNMPVKEGAVVYERIFTAPGESKALLYSNAQLWLISQHKTGHNIQLLDPDLGRVVGTGIDTTAGYKMMIQVDCKNGRYRCRIYNINFMLRLADKSVFTTTAEDMITNLSAKNSSIFSTGLTKKQERTMLDNLNMSVNNLMLSLNNAMAVTDDF